MRFNPRNRFAKTKLAPAPAPLAGAGAAPPAREAPAPAELKEDGLEALIAELRAPRRTVRKSNVVVLF